MWCVLVPVRIPVYVCLYRCCCHLSKLQDMSYKVVMGKMTDPKFDFGLEYFNVSFEGGNGGVLRVRYLLASVLVHARECRCAVSYVMYFVCVALGHCKAHTHCIDTV